MFRIIVLISLGMLLNLHKLFAQDTTQVFTTDDFEFRYPKKWKMEIIDNKFSFYKDVDTGDITISTYPSEHLSRLEIKQMLLDINEQKEKQPDLQLSMANETITCVYKYSADNFRYLIKAIQNDKKMYLITLVWKESYWNRDKKILMHAFNSFRIK